ncbi:hypothetical protein CCO03_12770 [Comamonas serinivorans]|uniref:Purine nucleoside phosphorylase n=1 Tax=Comamonas serinivorans TaxID=1082851 RepID=A0A1Y0EP69_9BURK|nr:polyphenol oxidase family protein [Comamonas serinivorans]ARU05444.1 hypothetical protein CCO03_12770 [Comamonas serinivorans]
MSTNPLESGRFAQQPHFQVLRPEWPAPSNVQAAFTERGTLDEKGGDDGAAVAAGLSHFNLGAHVGDDPGRVARHRAAVDARWGVQAVYLNQVHGRVVQPLADGDAQGATADASWTTAPGVACAIMVADCLPVLMTNRQGDWVGAAHAGWRGLAGEGARAQPQPDADGHRAGFSNAELPPGSPAGDGLAALPGGVLEALVQAYLQVPAAQPGQVRATADLVAWLGPCIGPTAFEVGPEVRAAFLAQAGAWRTQTGAQFTPQPGGKFLANLPGLARLWLAATGVTAVHGNDGTAAWCTVGQPERFFSYRRDQQALGASGRMCAYIWLQAR